MDSFKRGYVWRVGNGQKINIWLDTWIPNSPNKKVILWRGGSNITKVCDLIILSQEAGMKSC
jgi:hypothetical protein